MALVITLVIGILVIAYIIGVIITMVRYYRFTLTRSGDFLKIRYGLLKVTNLSLPIAKLQAVQEKKSFLDICLALRHIILLLQVIWKSI